MSKQKEENTDITTDTELDKEISIETSADTEKQKAIDKKKKIKDDETEETDASKKANALDTEEEKLSVKAVYDLKEKVAIASTDVVDRHGERINQDGWDLKNFKANPVLLWGHDHTEIAVGNARNIHIERAGGTPRLVFTPDFHTATDKARALKTLYDEGRLNSFSVGFVPKEFDGKDAIYLKQELLEISAVNVPANPEARMLAYKSLKKSGFNDKTIAEMGIKKTEAPKVDEEVKEEPIVEKEKTILEKIKLLYEGTDLSNEKYVEIFSEIRGAVQDEIDEDKMMEQKSMNMRDIHEIFWAFCDVYYDEDTPVEDFEKLLTEMMSIMSQVVDGTYDSGEVTSTEGSVDTEDSKVLDKDLEKTDDDSKQVKTQANKDTSVAPTEPQKEARAKQSLSKVIAKASDKLLEDKGNNNEQFIKIIKRAAEILNASHKK